MEKIKVLFINLSKENSIEATHWVELNLDGFDQANARFKVERMI